MRKVETTIFCDRCGKDITGECVVVYENRAILGVYADYTLCKDVVHKDRELDLCNECRMSLNKWLKGKEKCSTTGKERNNL